MPELPEVEFARRLLDRALCGGRIERVEGGDALVVREASRGALARGLRGRTVTAVERRGKRLRIVLDQGAPLYAHLGMTGKWVHIAYDLPRARFERIRVIVRSRRGAVRAVAYVDPRRLGRIERVSPEPRAWRELGPDPLLDGVDPGALAASLAARRQSIKEALLDQRLVAGVGNIQAQEALFLARIDPRREARSLDRRAVGRLARAIVASIEATLRAIPRETITYVEEARAPNPFRIYGRAGEPCPRCRRPLERIVQGGRGTVFCPRCQR